MLYLRETLLFIVSLSFCHGLFVPEQLPTLLSFIYTNIPPIRKGIDSRVGFGFRLGPNADFQVLFELGPQQNTVPLGPGGGAGATGGGAKRETRPLTALWGGGGGGGGDPSGLGANLVEEQTGEAERVGGDTGPYNLDRDIVYHLRQLYKKKKKQDTD